MPETADFQRTLWDPLNSSSIWGMPALPWAHRLPAKPAAGHPSFPLASPPPPLETACLSRHRLDPESCQRPRQPVATGLTPAAAQSTRKRRSRPMPCCGATTHHWTGEAFPVPRHSLCATPLMTRGTRGAGFPPAETRAAWHTGAVRGTLAARMTSTSPHCLLLRAPTHSAQSPRHPLARSTVSQGSGLFDATAHLHRPILSTQ